MRCHEERKFRLYPAVGKSANSTSLSGALSNGMEKTKPDSILSECGFRFADKLEGEVSAASFNSAAPTEGNIRLFTFSLKLQSKMPVVGFDPMENNFRLNGVPMMVSDRAIDRPDNLAVLYFHL